MDLCVHVFVCVCVYQRTNSFYTTQYHTSRISLERVGEEDKTEKINRIALKIAREVADDTSTLCAGGLSSTNLLQFPSPAEDATERVRAIFEEQVRWSKEEGVDYIIAETIWSLAEAKIAVEVIASFDLPAVVTLAVRNIEKKEGVFQTHDGVAIPEACRQLAEMGATLVGVNCAQGPGTMIEVVEQICKVVPPEKVCALPIAYRTTEEEPTWWVFTDKAYPKNNPSYPNGLEPFYVTRMEIVEFTKRCLELGLRYIGICCGNTGSYTQAMAQAMGKETVLSKYHDKAAKVQAITEEFMKKVNKK